MPNLKDLRSRKKSILATHKITSAMKMIAAAKLKRAGRAVEKARPYAASMAEMLRNLLSHPDVSEGHPLLRSFTGPLIHVIVVVTSNRGLCGGFNTAVVKQVKRLADEEKAKGHTIKILCWGYKGRDQLRRLFSDAIIDTLPASVHPSFEEAVHLSTTLQELFSKGDCHKVSIIYNRFVSVLSQEIKVQRLIPFEVDTLEPSQAIPLPYDYEPSREMVLQALVPQNLSVQLFLAFLESAASEQGARMAAMDAATRNAEDMIRQLNLQYNRTRQALITKELIEVISGAEAL